MINSEQESIILKADYLKEKLLENEINKNNIINDGENDNSRLYDKLYLIKYFSKIKIKIPNEAYITPLHNFGCSAWRCVIGNNKYCFSVYLDMLDSLGYVGEPYFELFCCEYKEDPIRFLVSELDEMNKFLERVLKDKKKVK